MRLNDAAERLARVRYPRTNSDKGTLEKNVINAKKVMDRIDKQGIAGVQSGSWFVWEK